jgi:hypothetical protein
MVTQECHGDPSLEEMQPTTLLQWPLGGESTPPEADTDWKKKKKLINTTRKRAQTNPETLQQPGNLLREPK